MDSKKKFLSVFVVLAVLVYVLPAAIAGSSGSITDNIVRINNLSDDNMTGDNVTGDNVTNGNSTNENATNDNTTTSPSEDDTCDDLIANFTADITCGYSPLTVNFNDTSQGEPTEWYWDFGDGGNSTEQNPVHTYCNSGKYDVTLTVTNDMGNDTIIKYDYISVGGPRNAQVTDKSCVTEVETCNENKTVSEDTTPVCEETKPVCKPVSKPVCKENKPVSKPVCKETKPVSKPVCKETKPVCKPKPVCEDTDQVSDDTQDEVNDNPDNEVCEETEEDSTQDTADGVNDNCMPV
jgi:PKD repeat protein